MTSPDPAPSPVTSPVTGPVTSPVTGPVPTPDDAGPPPLAAGLANAGAVVRIGDTVHRPWGRHTPAVHALLDHLAAAGFDGAPRVLGRDEQGRSMLSYLPGEVAAPPYLAWVADPSLLDGVAALQRRFHDAMATFTPPDGAEWDLALAPPSGGPLIVHNDVSVENVVVRDGQPVGLIDFDFAAPADPLWDVAIALRHWVPVRDPADLVRLADPRAGLDQVARFRRYCTCYGLPDADRGRAVELVGAFLRQALDRMRERFEAGAPGYVAAWQAGYPEQNLRDQAWLAANAPLLST